MMFAVITMVITADSKEQLENDTEALLTTARKHLCQFATLRFQQVDGLNTVMPFGTRKIDAFRTLTTESLSVFIPFRVQDIFHENGIYYGQNVISKNMIIADRKQLLNGNSFILGVSGGGKSFAAKGEIINQVLSSDADIIIIDPEREYSQLVNAMGGEVINISATSDNHINAMDMNKDYGDGANPVILKSEFIMSLCEQLIGGTNLGAKQKSIIDRCTASVYRSYQQNDYQGHIPTLQDFRAELLQQDEPEAKELALAIEMCIRDRVSVGIILQNLAQLKALFEKQWESIVGNCDEFLYLGGNEQSTHKYVSELLGKETIDTNTFGKSTGRSGNYSTNYQISGRELLTPDEVRMLDNQYAILFIRGERPIMDFKYDIMKHPNVALTTDGKASPYKHGEVTKDIASIAIWDIDPATLPEKEMEETNWELLSDEEMEALFINNQTN